MVLVAPLPALRPPSAGDAAATGAGTGSPGPSSASGGGPLRSAGGEVLALLRAGGTARPRFDPGLAGGLRAWLEDAAYRAVTSRGDGTGPLVLGPRQVLGPSVEPVDAHEGVPEELVVSLLVHSLFRQLVTVGMLDDPLGDALDALRVEGTEQAERVRREVEAMAPPQRATLAATVARHAGHLATLVPRLSPAWLPRTDDRVAVPLAGGRVVLRGVFDLLIGVPSSGEASLCAVGLTTGGPWPKERRSLHYLALLETLRAGTPPFRLALLDSSGGRYGVEDVREEHLVAMASHLAAWLAGGPGE